ncbi:hypothetical protein Verru16b_03082 [Lacunisphaera limnophila]|uniref:Uncharacterized protein TP-0789 domain-containing protein n=1 Tax=Lacunisphaera limnophila TaxID=1838286 RepID=A0A1D8AYQ5_9BACT|nr:hypothetical protein Verru16b_03082 [Lacunisphaera limnophila]
MLAVSPVWAQPAKFGVPSEIAASGPADQAEGARILGEFRQAGIAGDYWLAFELRVMPRHGAERTVLGALLGTRGPGGPLSRLTAGDGLWLIASGPMPDAWTLENGTAVATSPAQGLAGTGLTVFDLQMPFLYWKDFTYEGQARVRGRPTDSFILRPPAGLPVPVPELTGVRVLIDTQFQAMVQAELLGAKAEVLKSIALLDLKKVGEQWLVKSIDVRDHRTRDKTRFTVRAAALDLTWPDALFTPQGLTTQPPGVPADQVVRF